MRVQQLGHQLLELLQVGHVEAQGDSAGQLLEGNSLRVFGEEGAEGFLVLDEVRVEDDGQLAEEAHDEERIRVLAAGHSHEAAVLEQVKKVVKVRLSDGLVLAETSVQRYQLREVRGAVGAVFPYLKSIAVDFEVEADAALLPELIQDRAGDHQQFWAGSPSRI